jgi:hypothetical protein
VVQVARRESNAAASKQTENSASFWNLRAGATVVAALLLIGGF